LPGATSASNGPKRPAQREHTLSLIQTTTKTLYLGFMYNSADTKWDLLAKLDNF